MRPAYVSSFLSLFLLTATLQAADQPQHTKDSLQKVRKAVKEKKAILLDVREKREWDAGHLSSAQLLPLSELARDGGNPEYVKKLAQRIPPDKIIYCHCKSGGRVLSAAQVLRSLGYDCRPLRQGYQTLLNAGFQKAKPAVSE